MSEIIRIRHGETTWSASRQHTSYTDLELTPDGERQARALAGVLAGRHPATGARQPPATGAAHRAAAGLTVDRTDDDLVEWNYGRYEGRTTADIHTDRPDWDIWTDGCPDGESPDEIGARVDRLLARLAPLLERGSVGLVGHAHQLRVVGARWIGLPAAGGGKLRLDTATVSVLGHEHGRPVILRWNGR